MNKKRYAVTLDFYIYEDNDFMARKKAHEIKNWMIFLNQETKCHFND